MTSINNSLMGTDKFTKTDKEPLSFFDRKSRSVINSNTVVEDETEDNFTRRKDKDHIERRRTMVFRTKNSEKIYSVKEKRDILDHYRELFKIKKKNLNDAIKEVSSKIREEPDENEKLPTIKKNSNAHSTLELPLNSTQKSQMFKSSIYSLLFPMKYKENPNETRTGFNIGTTTNTLRNKSETTKSTKKGIKEYGPFLNFNYDEFNKRIEIKNPEVKKVLEDIEYYGPYFSHCPSCRNKNLEFYQTMEPHHCLNILNYLKKTRKKTVLRGSDDENNNNSLE